jgi:hypothetical protein
VDADDGDAVAEAAILSFKPEVPREDEILCEEGWASMSDAPARSPSRRGRTLKLYLADGSFPSF